MNKNKEQEENTQDITTVTKESFADASEVISQTKDGFEYRYLLLKDGRIAEVREGTGADMERATREVGNNRDKVMSAIMGAVTTIDGEKLNMFDIAALSMKDYNRILEAVSDINF